MTVVWNGDIQWRDLPINPRADVILWCPTCGARCSANKGDYFMADPDATIRCGEDGCGEPMRLARTVTKIEVIDPANAGEPRRG